MNKIAAIFTTLALLFFAVSVYHYLDNLNQRIAQEDRV